MADPRIKTPTQPITFRLHLPRYKELQELAEQHGMSNNQLVNEMIKTTYEKLKNKGAKRNG